MNINEVRLVSIGVIADFVTLLCIKTHSSHVFQLNVHILILFFLAATHYHSSNYNLKVFW